MKSLRSLIILFLLTSCTNKKNDFAQNYKDNFIHYTSNGRDIRLAWSGDENKRPLLFVHGSPGSFDVWTDFLSDKKLQSQFHILAVDRPGYGGSGSQSELSVKKQADEISDALQFNKSGLKAIVIGHSYGGAVIARMAMDHPEKIGGLIFVSGAVDPEYEDNKWYQQLATWKLFNWLVPHDLNVCNEESMALKSELDLMLPLWENIRAPSVLIQGDRDGMVLPGNLKFLKAKLVNSKVLRADLTAGLNHFVPWTRPDLIFDAIQQLSASY